eukprot:UN05238
MSSFSSFQYCILPLTFVHLLPLLPHIINIKPFQDLYFNNNINNILLYFHLYPCPLSTHSQNQPPPLHIIHCNSTIL